MTAFSSESSGGGCKGTLRAGIGTHAGPPASYTIAEGARATVTVALSTADAATVRRAPHPVRVVSLEKGHDGPKTRRITGRARS